MKLCPHSLGEINVACKPILTQLMNVIMSLTPPQKKKTKLPIVIGSLGRKLLSEIFAAGCGQKVQHLQSDLPYGMTVAKVQRRHDLSEELPGFFRR